MKLLVVLLLLTLSLSVYSEEKCGKKLSKQNLKDIEKAEKIGKEIYEQDELAWKATDLLIEKKLIKKDSKITGWVVDNKKSPQTVYFMGEEGKDIISVYGVEFKDGKMNLLTSPEIEEKHKIMFKARQNAIKQIKNGCFSNYNTIVIDDEKSYLVYILGATTKANTMVFGIHYKAKMSKKNGSLLMFDPLAKSCLSMEVKKDAIPVVTHLINETPIETHVFLSLSHKLPLYVGTNTGAFKIENGKIEFMGELNCDKK